MQFHSFPCLLFRMESRIFYRSCYSASNTKLYSNCRSEFTSTAANVYTFRNSEEFLLYARTYMKIVLTSHYNQKWIVLYPWIDCNAHFIVVFFFFLFRFSFQSIHRTLCWIIIEQNIEQALILLNTVWNCFHGFNSLFIFYYIGLFSVNYEFRWTFYS